LNTLSVIVPVFNTADTLIRCLESIRKQIFLDFSVLIVDDGSTDDSVIICKNWIKKDSRFHFIQNISGIHGPSQTRNIGLDYVNSEWVTFVDSDDWIDPRHFKNLMKYKEKDFCVVPWVKTNDYDDSPFQSAVVADNTECLVKALGMKEVSGYLWNKAFRSEIIKQNNLRFDEQVTFSEDLLFVLEYLSNIDQGYLIRAPATYHYINRINSITSSHTLLSEKEVFAELDVAKKIMDAVDKGNVKISNALKAHLVRIYHHTYLKAYAADENRYRSVLHTLRLLMLKWIFFYAFSQEYTLQSKTSAILMVISPNFTRVIKRLLSIFYRKKEE